MKNYACAALIFLCPLKQSMRQMPDLQRGKSASFSGQLCDTGTGQFQKAPGSMQTFWVKGASQVFTVCVTAAGAYEVITYTEPKAANSHGTDILIFISLCDITERRKENKR